MKLKLIRPGTLQFLLPLALAVPAFAFRAPDRPQLPNFDIRLKSGTKEAAPSPVQAQAAQRLKTIIPGSRVDFDGITGSPKFITGGGSFLTAQNGVSKGPPASKVAPFPQDPHSPTKAFIAEHQGLFRFGPEVLDISVIKRDSVAAHNSVRTVIWQQQVRGIPVFDATFVSHTTSKGELVSISSGFIPDLDTRIRTGNPDLPRVSAREALASAAQNVGESTKSEEIQVEPSQSAGKIRLRGSGLSGDAVASLVWFPLRSPALRLAWETVFTSRSRSEMFRALVDAESGEVLIRHCLTEYLSDASYRVFTSDSPSPFSPGWPTPNSTQPAAIPRQLITLSAMDTNASPLGWIPDAGNETAGNNVDAHTDTNSDDAPDLPRPQGLPARVFDFTLDLATQDPSGYRPAAVVQLFYLSNWMHDRLYSLGFDEQSGNFQNNNFGRGGAENDALMADAQDGSGTDNANFSAPLDGMPPRMQMFIFDRPTPKRDGDLDCEIVLHEYTHGLSARHVNGGSGLSSTQSRGMGEGWSDFYSLSLLSSPADDLNACYPAGGYASYMIGGTGDTQNYYFGIRRYPYTTDMTKNPLTFKDIDPAQADYCSSGAPYHTGMFGSCNTNTADEVHNQGEVWCVTLWEARARLVSKYGYVIGNELALQLVTDGMLFAPGNPNFLQARDGILQADLVNNAGANLDELWAAFAKRGMGFSASSPSSSTVTGVQEAFDVPDDLRISPKAGFVASGPVGGPFNVTNITFALSNASTSALSWVLTNNGAWLDVSPSGGLLLPGSPVAPVTATLNASSRTMPAGLYTATILFTNLDSLGGQRRDFLLRVGQPEYMTEVFDANDNDLAYSTLTFTPNGSSSFYAVCHEPATTFPTDPANGNVVSLADDTFTQVTLAEAKVSLYGQTNNVFYIGSNGYLTMGTGDNAWTESPNLHFSKRRISALFHDQLPVTSTVISWKQLPDRVAVTYQNLADILEAGLNDFQIEWFYDGRIRITYLRITNRQNLVGLSAGAGVPAGFVEMDLSASGPCRPLQLATPASATEGDGVLASAGQIVLPEVMSTNVSVALSSSDSSVISVPAFVLIPAGENTAHFDISIKDDTVLDGTQLATIRAVGYGLGSASRQMQVFDNETATLSLVVPGVVLEGQGTAKGTVKIETMPAMNVLVNLSSSDTNKLIVPATTLLPAGSRSGDFEITVVDDGLLNPATVVTLSASVQNWRQATAELTVLDNPVPVLNAQNAALISIADSGPATPYPSTITVNGAAGTVSKLSVTLSNIAHTYPDDVGVMLVGPTGTNLVLLANSGGGGDVTGVTLTFDDAALSRLPDAGPMTSGTYQPTSIAPGSWPAPAPPPSPADRLSIFKGTDPNGVWRLYVYDDSAVDAGRIANGWSLSIRTESLIPLLLSPKVEDGVVRLMFSTVPSHTYFLECMDDLASANWSVLSSVQGDGTMQSMQDASGSTKRFYRVRVQ